MKIVRPQTITDSVLVSSSVPETDYPAFDSNAAYNINDYCIVVAANTHKIYQSLIGSASAAVTMTIASPCVVSWTSHGQAAGTPIYFTTTGALPTGLVANTVYYVLAPTASTFNVAATVGGVAINTSGTQSGVHTAKAGNINKTPASYPAVWRDAGITNRWKMFDRSVGSVTSNPDEITSVFAVVGRVDHVIGFGVSAAAVRVTMTDAIDGIVYDKTQSLINYGGINDWAAYVFEPSEKISEFSFTDLPRYANATITVTLTNTGNTVECGTCIIGLSRWFGDTQFGLKLGIDDYSIKGKNAWGDYDVHERAFSDQNSLTVTIESSQVDSVKKILSGYRATPIVYIGTDNYRSTMIYGFFTNFGIIIPYATESVCSLEVESLV
ncbi:MULTISPECIES: hypothetical protein [Methylobacter]